MSRSNNPLHYPHGFFRVAEHFDALPLYLYFPTRKEAQRSRFLWYDFLRALRAGNHVLLLNAERISAAIEYIEGGKPEPYRVAFTQKGGSIADMLNEAIESALARKLPPGSLRDAPPLPSNEERAALASLPSNAFSADGPNAMPHHDDAISDVLGLDDATPRFDYSKAKKVEEK